MSNEEAPAAPEKTIDEWLDDRIAEYMVDAIGECRVTGWALVAEGIGSDGEPFLWPLPFPGQPYWRTIGLLRAGADEIKSQIDADTMNSFWVDGTADDGEPDATGS